MKVEIDPKYFEYASEIEAIPASYENLKVSKVFCNNRNNVLLIKIGPHDCVLKRYKRPIFINRIIYSFIRPDKAKRAYKYAKRLLQMGISTPYPVAYMATYSRGLFDMGYFISEYSPYQQLYQTDSLSAAQKEELYRAFANFTAELHKKGICHPDYNPGNILWNRDSEGKFRFMLVDINRVRFGVCPLRSYLKGMAEEHLPANLIPDYCRIMGYDLAKAQSLIKKRRHHNLMKKRIKAFFRGKKRTLLF